MSIMKRIGMGIATGLAALTLNYGAAQADSNARASAEVYGNAANTDAQGAVVADVKANIEVMSPESPFKLGYFMRNKMTTAYDGTVSNFNLNELNIGQLAGIRATGQCRFINAEKIEPRAGLSIFQKLGNLRIYGAAGVNVNGEPVIGEGLLVVGYELPAFRKEDAIDLELEQFGWFGKESQSGQTLVHVGYDVSNRFMAGLAGQANYGTGLDSIVSGGVFLRVHGN